MADMSAIRRKMRQRKITIQRVAASLSMDQSTFHRKTNKNGATFTLEQAQVLAEILELTPQEAQEIFFSKKLA